jgi:hypothetical protein
MICSTSMNRRLSLSLSIQGDVWGFDVELDGDLTSSPLPSVRGSIGVDGYSYFFPPSHWLDRDIFCFSSCYPWTTVYGHNGYSCHRCDGLLETSRIPSSSHQPSPGTESPNSKETADGPLRRRWTFEGREVHGRRGMHLQIARRGTVWTLALDVQARPHLSKLADQSHRA